MVAGLQVVHLVDGDRQEVAGPEIGIDPQGKDGEVPGAVGEQPLDEDISARIFFSVT